MFHSLKMRPVYFEKNLYPILQEIISSDHKYDDDIIVSQYGDKSKNIIGIIDGLIENRVLNEHPDKDIEVLSYFQQSLTPSIGNIKIAYFILSEACNLACSYCFENAQDCSFDSDKIMSEEIASKSINFFEKMLTLYNSTNEEKDIIFYGGEPLINYDVLLKILKEIQKRKANNKLWNNVSLSIVTNGVLLTEEIIKTLHDYGVEIAISIDGPKKINDKNRFNKNHKSIFKEVMAGIQLCKNNDVPFSLSMTLSEDSVRYNEDVMKFIDEVKPKSIGFNILMTNSTFQPYENYNEEAASFLIKAFRKFRKENLYEDRIMRKVKSFVKSEVYPFDCGATGANQLVFSPAGQVGICHGYLQDKKFFPSNVDDLNFKPSENQVFTEWGKRSPLNMQECHDCPALGICGGGCPMNAERDSGSIWDLDDRFCVHAKKTLEWMVWDLFEKSQG